MEAAAIPSSIDEVRSRFAASGRYLDTASVGLPCAATVDAMRDGLDAWAHGHARPIEYDACVADSREAFAALLGVDPGTIAVGSQVSAFVGVVASSLPAGAEVLCPQGEFTSMLFPFLVRRPELTVRTAPLEVLAEAVRPSTDVVAFSLVQSSDGRVADSDAIVAAASRHHAVTLVDVTQACGWLPVDARRFDMVVAGAYKWLLAPRGAAFMAVRSDRLAGVSPILAGWYAGDDVWNAIYGTPLRLAADARRLDMSPAWLSWVGAAPALRCILDVGVDAIHRHDVALANRLRGRLGMPASNSAIVALPATSEQVNGLREADVRASIRAGQVRVCFHLYNDDTDVDAVAEVLLRDGHADQRR